MSVVVSAWVLRHSEERLGNRLVLLVLADHANSDGTNVWASVETIARHARMSGRQTRSCLRTLEASGAVERTGVSSHGTNVYRVVMEGGEESSAPPEKYDRRGGEIEQGGRSDFSAEPRSLEQPTMEPSRKTERARGWKVNGKRVAPEEEQFAVRTLREWNLASGQALRAREWLAKIVMRIREHPELDLPEHTHIIHASLANPWWQGNPSPAVIYGNGSVFEQQMNEARNPTRRKAGLTPDEIRAFPDEKL